MRSLTCVVATVLLVACGGGGSSNSGSTLADAPVAVDLLAKVQATVAITDSAADVLEPDAIESVTIAASEDTEPVSI